MTTDSSSDCPSLAVFEANFEKKGPSLEQDMISASWLVTKVRDSDSYAQNLYAALCNNEFQANQVWPCLQGHTWSCSWRYAGGIIADIRGQGDYLDWYCSGMDPGLGNSDADGGHGYVSESVITPEIMQDLKRLGWNPVPNELD